MVLSDTQWKYLRLLEKAGGTATCKGLAVRIGEQTTSTGAPISFLNLVAKGAVEGKDGVLRITEYGRSLLQPF